MSTRWSDIKGKGLGRLLHFIEWYCGKPICDHVVAGWTSNFQTVPTLYGAHQIPYTNEYREWVERSLIYKKAHGFLTVNNVLLCYYWWEENSDVPNFEFTGTHALKWNKAQEEFKAQAIADEETPFIFEPEVEDYD